MSLTRRPRTAASACRATHNPGSMTDLPVGKAGQRGTDLRILRVECRGAPKVSCRSDNRWGGRWPGAGGVWFMGARPLG